MAFHHSSRFRLMFTGSNRSRATRLHAALLVTLATLPAAADVGRTTAVVQESRGTPPAHPTRVLVPRLNIFENERIQTDTRGVTQILFTDGTNLTVGPNSDLVIDRFSYDPDTTVGDLAAKLARGLVRFVGGQISKRGRAAIETPVAVIGVRGGIAVVEHGDAGETSAVLLFGAELTVTGVGTAAMTRRVTRPGFSVTVRTDGRVSAPARLPPDKLESVLASLEGNEDSDGGAQIRPSRDSVQGSAYATTPPPAPAAAEPLIAEVAPTEEESVATLDEARATTDDEDDVERDLSSPAALWRYRRGESTVFTGLDFLASVPVSGYPLTFVKPEGEVAGSRFLRTRMELSGHGADQVASVSVLVGRVLVDREGEPIRVRGRLVGSARDAQSTGTKGVFLIWGILDENVAIHSTPAFADPGPPRTFNLATGYFDFDSVRHADAFHPDVVRTQAHVDRSEHASAGNVEYVFADSIPIVQAGERGDRNWHGYATALFEVRTSNADVNNFEGTYSLGNRTGAPTDVSYFARAESGELGSVFRLGNPMIHEGDPGSRAVAPGNLDVTEMEVSFGRYPDQPVPEGMDFISGTRGTYVTDDVHGAVSSVGFDSVGNNFRLIYVNGELVYRMHHATRVWMVSNAAASADGLLPTGVEYCDCPAAKFGWWGGHIGVFGGGPEGVREDAVFPGTFVVGELPEMADLPNEGTASYSGHAAAAIRNAGTAYTAVGRFDMDWDFAARNGEARISNLDGRTYAAPDLAAPVNPRDFGGMLTEVGGAATGPIDGSFFADDTSAVRDVGGQFRVQDGAYTAVGSFAATQ